LTNLILFQVHQRDFPIIAHIARAPVHAMYSPFHFRVPVSQLNAHSRVRGTSAQTFDAH
jgi:hypothetical protein